MVGNGGVARVVRRRRSPVLLAALLVFALTAPVPGARAIGDDLDPTFGAGGTAVGPAGSARALIEVDGNLVVGGCVYAVNSGCSAFILARYSPNGMLDSTFGVGGRATTELGENDGINAVAAQGDKLVVAGTARQPGASNDFVVARYTPVGELDPNFGTAGVVRTNFGGTVDTEDKAFAIVVIGDKLVVAGSSDNRFALARYDANGNLDPTFGMAGRATTDFGGASGGARALAIQVSDNVTKLIAAGSGGGVGGRSDFALARYDGSGILDPSFGGSGDGKVATEFGNIDQARAVVVQANGIVVAGVTDTQLTTPPLVALARYDLNGAPDRLFGANGQATGPPGVGFDIVVAGEGKLVVAGRSSAETDENSNAVLARFNSNGSLDPTFGVGGVVKTNFEAADNQAASVLVQASSQKIVVAGHRGGIGSNGFNIVLARYEAGAQLADLSVTLTDAPDPAAVGENITYQAAITNIGPGSAAQARLVAPPPIGAELVSAASSQGACTLRSATRQSDPLVPREVNCDLRSLLPGQSVTVTLVARTTTEGTATAIVVVDTSSLDTNPLNNSALTTTTVGPAAGQWNATAPMTTGRSFHTATMLSGARCAAARPSSVCGQVLVVGGQGLSGSALKSAELYDPASGTWIPTGDMQTARFKHTATILSDGRVLVAGGGSSDTSALPSSEVYDPGSKTWSNVTSPTGERLSHAATRLPDGRVLVQGGYSASAEPPCPGSSDVRLRTAQTFNPIAPGTWATAATMAEGRALHSSTLLAPTGEVLVVGGRKGDRFSVDDPGDPCDGGGPAAAPEVFVPATGAWRATGDNAIHRWNHTATDLQDGRVLLAGGETNPNGVIPTPSVELYDPLAIDVTTGAVGSWRSVRSLASARTSHTATRLAGGQVLVTGGRDREQNGASATFASAELYDPVRNRWSSAGLMASERYSHTATLLGPVGCGSNCGKVLVVGGSGGVAAGSSAELYTPALVPAVTGLNPSRGPSVGGTPVVITGSGFDRADLVRFGETEATFRVDSPSRITATSPALPGGTVVDVVVSGPGGTSSIGPANRFTYDFSPPGSVGELVARAESETVIALSFTAPGGDGPFAPAARRYRIKQSRTSSMPDAVAFAAAPLLCDCEIDPPPGVGDAISLSVGDLVPGTTYHYAVQALNEAGQGGPISNSASATTLGVAPVLPPTTLPGTQPGSVTGAVAAGGYRLVAADGGIFAFGDSRFLGSTGGMRLAKPVVGMASTPSGNGYRLVAADGGIFAFGDARFLGSTGAIRLNRPIVGVASTPTGNGYWLVAADGGIFAFGDARFIGSAGAIRLAKPVVGMASAPSGNGYWLVAEDGGIFAFGDARFLGSTGAIRLNRPIVGMASTPSGSGYRLVGADGGTFAFGAAPFLGSTGGLRLNSLVVGMAGGR